MKKIILVYHQINEDDPFMSVSFLEFKKQINYLESQKFIFCNIDELMAAKSGNNVCIMFDDGFKSILPAVEYMKNKDLKFSIAIIPSLLNKEEYLSEKDLTGTIYFHTNNHYDLTTLSTNDLEKELKCDYQYYSQCIVYPMGKYNQDVIHKVKRNYNYGLSLLPFHISKKSNNFELPRICVNGYLKFSKFKLFVSKLGNIYLHLAFFKRKILKQDYLSR